MRSEPVCVCGYDHSKKPPTKFRYPPVVYTLESRELSATCHICRAVLSIDTFCLGNRNKLWHKKTCLFAHDTKANRERAMKNFKKRGVW